MTQPRIILHIGRNKAGSTTIQEACARGRDILAAHGIGYGLFGHLCRSSPELPGWLTFDQLAAHASLHTDCAWLVSNEFMSAWTTAFTHEAGRALAGCDVTIIAYLRRYDEWVRSAYAEDTRQGMNCRTIDDYVESILPRVSMLPNLADWAACFGWDRIQVRSVHPDDLVGGDLLTDFAQAVGLRRGLPRVARQNPAPSWTELELVRRLTSRDADEAWGGADPEAVLPLVALLRSLDDGIATADYFTREVRTALNRLYARDAATLAAFGHRITVPQETFLTRSFLPAFERIPADLRDCLFAAAAVPAFVKAHPVAARAAIRLRQDLCWIDGARDAAPLVEGARPAGTA